MAAGLDKETLDLTLEAFRDFARDKLPDEVLLELDAKDEFPIALVRELCGEGLGIQLLFIEEEYGGTPLDAISEAIRIPCACT